MRSFEIIDHPESEKIIIEKRVKDVVSCSGFKKTIFSYIFRKYNILRVYCKNCGPKYGIFTKLQQIVESTPRLINLIN